MAMTTEEKKVTKETKPVYANITVLYSNGNHEQYEFIRFSSIGQMSDNGSLMTFTNDDGTIYIINTNEVVKIRIDIIKEEEVFGDGDNEEA